MTQCDYVGSSKQKNPYNNERDRQNVYLDPVYLIKEERERESERQRERERERERKKKKKREK